MTRFIIRRLLSEHPGHASGSSSSSSSWPGSSRATRAPPPTGRRRRPQLCAQFEVRYGLDKPIREQFVIYFGAIAQGDLGTSIKFGRPVTDLLPERLPVTIELTVVALIFASVVGITLGVLSATRRNSPVDVATMIVANLGVSTPVFVLGLFLAFVFAVLLRDTPFAPAPVGSTDVRA